MVLNRSVTYGHALGATPKQNPRGRRRMRRTRWRSKCSSSSAPRRAPLSLTAAPSVIRGGCAVRHIAGLRTPPSRPKWTPGGGGLTLHSLVAHPSDARQLGVAISAAGVFHTADGGETWEPRNRGTRADFLPAGENYPEYGQCVHSLVMAPGKPDRLYQAMHALADRKSTRLNSSHANISYAVFCLTKKKI